MVSYFLIRQFSDCARKLWLTSAAHVTFSAGNSSHSKQFPYHSFAQLPHGVSCILFHTQTHAHTQCLLLFNPLWASSWIPFSCICTGSADVSVTLSMCWERELPCTFFYIWFGRAVGGCGWRGWTGAVVCLFLWLIVNRVTFYSLYLFLHMNMKRGRVKKTKWKMNMRERKYTNGVRELVRLERAGGSSPKFNGKWVVL